MQDVELSEDQVIEIVELISRQKLEIERKSIRDEEEGDQTEIDLDYISLQDAKLRDIIYINYQVEFKQVQAIMHYYMQTSEGFEQRIMDKEQEIMDASI